MESITIMMIGLSVLMETESALTELGGGKEFYTLDEIRKCAMKSISKLADGIKENREKQTEMNNGDSN